ncbi:hypothetical protein, partial [Escherichia coli]|uniref:hypothetical protein n=1 Tax=Escherichia coli TaxID=562 RepID=UPI0020C05DAB
FLYFDSHGRTNHFLVMNSDSKCAQAQLALKANLENYSILNDLALISSPKDWKKVSIFLP